MKKEIIEWTKSIVVALVLGFIITSFIKGARVHGDSMNPTLNHDDVLVTLNTKNVNHGDIAILDTDLEINEEDLMGLNSFAKWKAGKTKKIIKRVVAIEGDNLVIHDGKVFLNGEEIKENYINGEFTLGDMTIESIPKGKVFVMGDNRGRSLDSRDGRIGLVDIDDIMGKAIFRVYPFSKIGILK